jgi:hypothetical protein
MSETNAYTGSFKIYNLKVNKKTFVQHFKANKRAYFIDDKRLNLRIFEMTVLQSVSLSFDNLCYAHADFCRQCGLNVDSEQKFFF